MARPITLFTSQWADLPLDKICSLAAQMGYDGLELTKNAHLDAEKMIRDPSYAEEIKHKRPFRRPVRRRCPAVGI